MPAPGSPDSHTRATSIGIEATNAPIQALGETLESSLAMPVVDETGLTGQYDFELAWEYGDRASIEGELAKLGLQLAPARREVEMLIIEG